MVNQPESNKYMDLDLEGLEGESHDTAGDIEVDDLELYAEIGNPIPQGKKRGSRHVVPTCFKLL